MFDSAAFLNGTLRAENSSASPVLQHNNSITTPVLGSASPSSTLFPHRSRNSADSTSSNAAHYGSGIPPNAAEAMANRGLLDAARARESPSEVSDRNQGGDVPHMGKDSKSLFNMFRHKKKQREDGVYEDLDSPTVVGGPLPKPYNRTVNINDLASHQTVHISSTRIYVLATMDYWTYRMCDVTGAHTGADVRREISMHLGLTDYPNALVYQTELGRFEHLDALDDDKLVTIKRAKADTRGSLKFFVSAGVPQSATSVASSGVPASLSPGYVPPGTKLDEEAYLKLSGRQRSSSSPPTSRSNSVAEDRPVDKDVTQEATEYKAELERRQREYYARRRQANKKESPTAPEVAAGYGIQGSRNVDFDQPRGSPFEEKRPDPLFPQRRPPAPPSDPSATLIKANSLKKTVGHLRGTSGGADGFPTPRRPTGFAADRGSSDMSRRKPAGSPSLSSPGVSGSNGGSTGQSATNNSHLASSTSKFCNVLLPKFIFLDPNTDLIPQMDDVLVPTTEQALQRPSFPRSISVVLEVLPSPDHRRHHLGRNSPSLIFRTIVMTLMMGCLSSL